MLTLDKTIKHKKRALLFLLELNEWIPIVKKVDKSIPDIVISESVLNCIPSHIKLIYQLLSIKNFNLLIRFNQFNFFFDIQHMFTFKHIKLFICLKLLGRYKQIAKVFLYKQFHHQIRNRLHQPLQHKIGLVHSMHHHL